MILAWRKPSNGLYLTGELMDFISNISAHWLEVLVVVFLLGMILYGHYRGFIRLAVSAAALVLTLLAVRVTLPYATELLRNETPIYGVVESGIEHAVGIDEILENLGEEGEEDAQERTAIEGLNLPEKLKRSLIENNNSEVYARMGVSLFREYISSFLTDMIVEVAVFIILFIVIFVILRVIAGWLNLIAKLPVLYGLNQIAGALLGGALGMVILWLLCIVLTLFVTSTAGIYVMDQIDQSSWLCWIYDHNMLSVLVVGLLQSIL